MNKEINGERINNVHLIELMIMICSFVILITYNIFKLQNQLDADMAEQLVYSNFIASEHSFLSKNYFYTTELRVLTWQLVYSPLFFVTSNWRLVRILGNIVLYIGLLISLFYFCKQANMKRFFWILGILYLLPISEQYFLYVLKNINYIPYLIIHFFVIGSILQICNNQNIKNKIILVFALFLVSLGAGLNGLRQILLTYIPLTIIVSFFFIKKVKDNGVRSLSNDNRQIFRNISVVIGSIAFAVVGYLCNSLILSKIYSFKQYETIVWDYFSIIDLFETIYNWMINLGFRSGSVFSIITIQNMIGGIIFIVVIVAVVKAVRVLNDIEFCEALIIEIPVISLVCSIILYTFTNMTCIPRYDLLAIVLLWPVVIKLGEKYNKKSVIKCSSNNNLTSKWIIMPYILVACGIFASVFNYIAIWSSFDEGAELKKIVFFLQDNGYYNGYSTFWQATPITELSNGDIDVWSWQANGEGDFADVNQVYGWGQKKNHKNTHPVGKIFWILDDDEFEVFSIAQNIDEENILYRTDVTKSGWHDELIVIGFDSYEDMLVRINQ